MARKLKAAELFLSLGLAASLFTACGPQEGGEATSDDEAPAPTEEVEPETEGGEGGETEEVEPETEGGEGGEGDEGASIDRGLLWAAVLEESAVV